MQAFVPWYSSVHRGAGYKSQMATAAYEEARAAALAFAGREGRDDIAILCRNTTEAINHLAYRLRLSRRRRGGDHRGRAPRQPAALGSIAPPGGATSNATRRVGSRPDDVAAVLDDGARPRLLAVTAASNVTGWRPPLDQIIDAAHERGIPVLVDAAQLAAHHPLPARPTSWPGAVTRCTPRSAPGC